MNQKIQKLSNKISSGSIQKIDEFKSIDTRLLQLDRQNFTNLQWELLTEEIPCLITKAGISIAELERRNEDYESAMFNGNMTSKITGFANKIDKDINGITKSYFSGPFYAG